MLDIHILEDFNASLDGSVFGFPSEWGRSLVSLEILSSFKAEQMKTFPLQYALILLSARGVDTRLKRLWKRTQEMKLIVFDPTPMRKDVQRLDRLVQQSHAIYADFFFRTDSHRFSMTPTTHAILHLPDIMIAVGPLLNVSQFLAERVIGEIGKKARSVTSPHTNLLNQSMLLLSLGMLNDGFRNSKTSPQAVESISERSDILKQGSSLCENTEVERVFEQTADKGQHKNSFGGEPQDLNERNLRLLGNSSLVAVQEQHNEAIDIITARLSAHEIFESIVSVRRHDKAHFIDGSISFDIETSTCYGARKKGMSITGCQ